MQLHVAIIRYKVRALRTANSMSISGWELIVVYIFVCSNNDIKDVGFNYVVDGIVEQRFGLSVLMVWNNKLTRNIAYTVVRLLVSIDVSFLINRD